MTPLEESLAENAKDLTYEGVDEALKEPNVAHLRVSDGKGHTLIFRYTADRDTTFDNEPLLIGYRYIGRWDESPEAKIAETIDPQKFTTAAPLKNKLRAIWEKHIHEFAETDEYLLVHSWNRQIW